GITILSGVANCYNALQTITVAGSSTIFVVMPGGSATMIAGLKINYLPGAKVNAGGYMNGYITATAQYCTQPVAPLVATAIGEDENIRENSDLFNVYPNPTTGSFKIKLNGNQNPGKSNITVYGSLGEPILQTETDAFSNRDFSLSGKPSGVYFIRVINGNSQQTTKILKQ
ncbi:MAG: T9SS type A sorting domain-containing protein, partial [Bacteroidetes bacterium]|nr:T9SS type A sorting domain-containing protein [Bacteroidota bacterium]